MTRMVSCSQTVSVSSLEFFSGEDLIDLSRRYVVEKLEASCVVRGRVSVSVRKKTLFYSDVLIVTATAYTEED